MIVFAVGWGEFKKKGKSKIVPAILLLEYLNKAFTKNIG